MTGKFTHIPSVKVQHSTLYRCPDMPRAEDHITGSIWQCDDCDQEWVVVEGVQYNESWTAWYRLEENNREGYWR